MEGVRHTQVTRGEQDHRHTQHSAANARWFAFSTLTSTIVVQSLSDPPTEEWHISYEGQDEYDSILLDFSPAELDQLAIATRHRVHVYNVAKRTQTFTTSLNTRATTSIVWSPREPHLLASGHIDGRVKLSDTRAGNEESYASAQIIGPVTAIAWSGSAENLLALASTQQLCIWYTDGSPRPVARFEKYAESIHHLKWHPRHTSTLLTASRAGQLTIWDFTQATHTPPERSSKVLDTGFSAVQAQKLQPGLSMNSQRRLFAKLWDLLWVSAQTALVLYDCGSRLARVDVRSPRFGTTDWKTDLNQPAWNIVIRECHQGTPELVAIAPDSVDGVDLQIDALDRSPRLVETDAKPQTSLPQRNTDEISGTEPNGMSLLSVLRLQHQTLHTKTSRVSPTYDSSVSIEPGSHSATHSSNLPRNAKAFNDEPSASRLDISHMEQWRGEPSMPFLSPTIPARSFNYGVGPPTYAVHESPPTSPIAKTSAIFGVDSDSEDDGYGMQRSKKDTAHSRVGVCVPLPRSCGATFAANGFLLTFHPSLRKSPTARLQALSGSRENTDNDASEFSKAFPRFGNLIAELHKSGHALHWSNKADVDQPRLDVDGNHLLLALGLTSASSDSDYSWRPQALPESVPQFTEAGRTMVKLKVNTLSSLTICNPDEPQYDVVSGPEAAIGTLCEQNARIAAALERHSDSLLWTVLGQILTSASSIDGSHHETAATSPAKDVMWTDHPFGANWLVRRLMRIAEADANVRMLAYISMTLFAPSLPRSDIVTTAPTNGLPRDALPSRAKSQSDSRDAKHSLAMEPIQRVDSQVLEDSPTKSHLDSVMSSRQTSQPTTPKPDSVSSTPPWSFSALPRSAQRNSQSGSSGPEHARGSFTAAVRSYAQSVSDKFNVYSTSPPARRGGPSPNKDLSSSLPSNGASWNKTVSFASTTRSSGLGRTSLEQDLEYDSDTTLEDHPKTWQPPQRKTKLNLKLTWKNDSEVHHHGRGSVSMPLIPADLLGMCAVWCTTYATQLRSKKQYLAALRFEKVAAAISAAERINLNQHEDHFPVNPMQSAVCSICFCIVDGLEQVCISCGHAIHTACSSHLRLHSEEFFCPSGCGCMCMLSMTSTGG